MDDELIDSAGLSLTRKSRLPGTGFFYPDSLDDDRTEERIAEAVEGAEAVVVADTDADGLGCVALLREVYDASLAWASFADDVSDRVDRWGSDEPADEGDEKADDEDRPRSTVGLVGAGPYSLDDALEHVVEHAPPGIDLYVCDLCPDEYGWIADELDAAVDLAASVGWYDHHQWDAAAATPASTSSSANPTRSVRPT